MPKTPNYTAEQTAALVEAYTACGDDASRALCIKAIADNLGKQPRSVIAKLSREGVYRKPERTAKRGGSKKDDVASAIAAVVRMTENEADSLAKANRTALDKLWSFIREQSGEVGPSNS